MDIDGPLYSRIDMGVLEIQNNTLIVNSYQAKR